MWGIAGLIKQIGTKITSATEYSLFSSHTCRPKGCLCMLGGGQKPLTGQKPVRNAQPGFAGLSRTAQEQVKNVW